MIIAIVDLLALVNVSAVAIFGFTDAHSTQADGTDLASTALEASAVEARLVVAIITLDRHWVFAFALVRSDVICAVCICVARICILSTLVDVLSAIGTHPASVAHAHRPRPFCARIPVPAVPVLLACVHIHSTRVDELDRCCGLVSHRLLKDAIIYVHAGEPITLPSRQAAARETTGNVDATRILVAVMSLQNTLVYVPIAVKIGVPLSAVAGVTVHAIHASVLAIFNKGAVRPCAGSMITAWV
jgi:hypothetical protein